MNTVGFPKVKMKEEKRIALLPTDISRIESPDFLFFARGYGEHYGFSDRDYRNTGAHIISDKNTYTKDIVCQPKFSDRDLAHLTQSGQIIFGWLHLGEAEEKTRRLEELEDTVIEWSRMQKRDNKMVFRKNNRLTGRIGVLHSIAYAGRIPEECNVAVIGAGNVGQGAIDQLEQLKVKSIDIYNRQNSKDIKETIGKYDIIVHCASFQGEILTQGDLRNMKPGALLVHLGSDSIKGRYDTQSVYSPISFINRRENPVYCINHVPTLAHHTATEFISRDVAPYINRLVKGNLNLPEFSGAIVIYNGNILHDRLENR